MNRSRPPSATSELKSWLWTSPPLAALMGWPAVTLAVLAAMAYGMVFGGDYGISLDEPPQTTYGRQTLQIYQGTRAIDDTQEDPLQHGPFFSFIAYTTGKWIQPLRPGWTASDGRHFIYYLSFVMAALFVGVLARRYTSRRVAWLTAALFFSQPVLLGHAFMNPKDPPFMAFFFGGLTLGILALPATRPQPGDPAERPASAPSENNHPDSERRPLRHRMQAHSLLLVATALAAAMLVVLWGWQGFLPTLQQILGNAYQGHAPGLLQAIFDRLATDAYKTPLSLYRAKLDLAFRLARLGTTALVFLGLVLGWGLRDRKRYAAMISHQRGYLLVAASGVMIGLATSIRAVAPLAALPLVVLYLIHLDTRRRAATWICILAATAAAACLATWPFLWADTFSRYLQAVLTLSHFPWAGRTLFNGQFITAAERPWYFVPELMLLQLTLPAIALVLVGLLAIVRRRLSAYLTQEIVLVLGTLSLPVLATFVPGSVVYTNFRQFLFVVPGLFVLSALGGEWALEFLRRRIWRIGLAVLILVPGFAGITRLHPYEYIYYNALAGPAEDVYQSFESDYWCTSYRPAVEWLNGHAEHGALVAIGSKGGYAMVGPFARTDLHFISMDQPGEHPQPTWAVLCDGKGGLDNLLPQWPSLFSVKRGGATLSQVKRLTPPP